jgi:DNA repair protein RadD
MSFVPRPYQTEAINNAIRFFKDNRNYDAIEILPTGSGKSVVIANIATSLEGNTVVFQPSKEILEQNYRKFTSYGYRAGIYSASAGSKRLDKTTFATIGSVAKKHHLFKDFQNIIIDECHLVNANDGMYRDFLASISHAKVLGLTATPYRLTSTFEGAKLEWITHTQPNVFSEVLYSIQNNVLFDAGHLAPLKYYAKDAIDRSMLQLNKQGNDFTAESLRYVYAKVGFDKLTAQWVHTMLKHRKNCLVFCSLIDEAYKVQKLVPGSVVITGDTEKSKRENILALFQENKIRCVINVGVLTTGFDKPDLESVVNARSTMSLSLYYQIVGRVMRPFKYADGSFKTGWYVDLGGNISKFGKIENMEIKQINGYYSIWNNGRQLTDVTFSKN